MPAIEVHDRNQKAVLWPASQVNVYGQVTVGTSEEIDVRWNDVRREALDPQGNTVTIEAEVVVDKPVAIGSLMWLGRLIDYDSTNVMAVIKYNGTPDLKGRHVRRTVSLMRFRGETPTEPPIRDVTH